MSVRIDYIKIIIFRTILTLRFICDLLNIIINLPCLHFNINYFYITRCVYFNWEVWIYFIRQEIILTINVSICVIMNIDWMIRQLMRVLVYVRIFRYLKSTWFKSNVFKPIAFRFVCLQGVDRIVYWLVNLISILI